MIKPETKSISELFSDTNKFEIPQYQRSYEWKKSEAIELIEDLRSYPGDNDKNKLFLGTVIFDKSKINEKTLVVVDGQQRITTLLILLMACRDHANEIGEKTPASYAQLKIAFVNQATGKSLGPRLVASSAIADIFSEMSSASWDKSFPDKINKKPIKNQVNKIKPIYQYFRDELKRKDAEELGKFITSLYESYVIKIDIDDKSEAFNIFERTNARGLDLEASDLIKNDLFSKGVERIEDIWQEIVENSAGSILRMLKYYYVSRSGYVTKSDLYKKLKHRGSEITPGKLIQEIKDFSDFYTVMCEKDFSLDKLKDHFSKEDSGCQSIIVNEEKILAFYSAIEGLRLFRVMQAYPLIYAAIKSFSKEKNDPKKLVDLVIRLERYHFINNAICDRGGNEVEKLYADYCVYFNERGFDEVASELIGALKGKVADEQEFKSLFVKVSYGSPKNNSILMYIFDRFYNHDIGYGSRVNIYNPDKRIQRKSHEIEHIYPKSPRVDKPALSADIVDNIGNLLVINASTNKSLSNRDPSDKFQLLKDTLSGEIANKKYVRDFINSIEINSWDEVAVKRRAENLAEEAYRAVWRIA